MALVFDGPVSPDALTTFVRNVPIPQVFALTALFPAITRPDNMIDFAEIVRTNRTARYRSFDGAIHVSARDAGSEKRVKIMALSSSLSLGEYERLQIEFARTGGTNVEALVQSVYNDGTNLTREIHARLEQAWGDVLTDGKLTINEDGFQGEADYGIPPSQIVTAAAPWSDPVNGKPLSDLLAWSDLYFANNGERPASMITSLITQRQMMMSAEIINAVYGAQMGRTRVAMADINNLLGSSGLPLMVDPYGTKVDVDGTATLCIPANKVILLPQDISTLGATVYGLSATALELVRLQRQRPGLLGGVRDRGRHREVRPALPSVDLRRLHCDAGADDRSAADDGERLMAGKELATSVTVHHDDGTYTTYEAGDKVPAEDARLITNEAAWGETEDDYGEEPTWTPDSGRPPPDAEPASRATSARKPTK